MLGGPLPDVPPGLVPPRALNSACPPSDMRRPAKGLVGTLRPARSASSSMAESSEVEVEVEMLARRSRGKKGEAVCVGEPDRPRVLMDMRRGGAIGVAMGAECGAEGVPETLFERLPKRALKVLEVKEPRRGRPAVLAGGLSSVMLSCGEGV